MYPFQIADNLEEEKRDQIKRFGGILYPVRTYQSFTRIVTLISQVPVDQRNKVAAELAYNNSGFFINQFGNADSAEEYHESE